MWQPHQVFIVSLLKHCRSMVYFTSFVELVNLLIWVSTIFPNFGSGSLRPGLCLMCLPRCWLVVQHSHLARREIRIQVNFACKVVGQLSWRWKMRDGNRVLSVRYVFLKASKEAYVHGSCWETALIFLLVLVANRNTIRTQLSLYNLNTL